MYNNEDRQIEKILDELIREERRGQRYFKDAAHFSRDPKIKNLFEYLAQEERRHLDVLLSIQSKLREQLASKPQMTRDGSQEKIIQSEYAGEDFLIFDLGIEKVPDKDLPQMSLFSADKFHELMENISVDAVLKFAMRIEYDNAKYIMDCRKTMTDPDYRKLLKDMALEEKQHFILLKQMEQRLKRE